MNARVPAPDLIDVDVVIVGSGGAGLMAALAACRVDPRLSVAVMSKGQIGRSGCSIMAQGYNAAMGPGDSTEAHFEDIVRGGHFLSDQALAWQLASAAPDLIRLLDTELGCFFDRSNDGTIELQAFPGQSRPRKVHRGHLTGLEIINRLREQRSRYGWRELVDTRALALLQDQHGVAGVVGLDIREGRGVIVHARSVVLASGGGAASLYRVSDTAREKTGDGVAIAYRAGLAARDMEFVQFLSVGLVAGQSRVTGVLLEEALRASGAYLINGTGDRFMAAYDAERMERAPRDVVVAACYNEILAGRGGPGGSVFLDATPIGAARLESAFADVVGRARRAGRDLTREPVPIAPCAHIQIGGIEIGPNGQTAIDGLFVAGEDAGGLHGASWQGGNGIAESTVFGWLAGRAGAERATASRPRRSRQPDVDLAAAEALRLAYAPWDRPGEVRPWQLWDELRDVMWSDVGLGRSHERLARALLRVVDLRDRANGLGISGTPQMNLDWQETLDLDSALVVSELVIRSAMARRESRGMQIRTDFPTQDDKGWLRTVLVRDHDGQPSVETRELDLSRLAPDQRAQSRPSTLVTPS